jgi:hypothetical protein
MNILHNEDTVNTCKYLARNREGEYHMEDLSAGWRIIQKRSEYRKGLWTEITSLRAETSF